MSTKEELYRERFLHYTMSFVGGIFALYALLEHSNVFGSAETSNLILIVKSLLSFDLYNVATRILSLFVYAGGIIFTLWMSRSHKSALRLASIIIDCAAAFVMGMLPKNTDPITALYPIAFAMSIQWCTFRSVDGNASATTFSTGNFRQVVTHIFNYICDGNKDSKIRAKFYVTTMLAFHTGVAAICIAWQYEPHKSIWIVFLPLAAAFAEETAIILKKRILCETYVNNTESDDI